MARGGNDGGPNEVRFQLTLSRRRDMDMAWKASGLDRRALARQWTWHHHQDVGVMQLVKREVHRAVPHRGGLSVLRAALEEGKPL